MPTIDFGRVQGDNGTSMRARGAWTPSTEYKNDEQYIDVITSGGNSYACKTTHTSDATFSDANWNLVAQKGDKGDKGDKGNDGVTPIIKAGTATSLASTASPTVTATTNGNTTTFNFGIPKGDTSDIKTPTFNDDVGTYTTLSAANTAAETASNAIKSKVSIFTTLSNAKKSFSAIVQGLKILATNVGAINGITDSLTSTSSNVAASAAAVKALNDKTTELNGNLVSYIKFVSGSANIAIQSGSSFDLKIYNYVTAPSGYAPLCVSSLDPWGTSDIVWIPVAASSRDNPTIRLINKGTSTYNNTVQFTVCFYKV